MGICLLDKCIDAPLYADIVFLMSFSHRHGNRMATDGKALLSARVCSNASAATRAIASRRVGGRSRCDEMTRGYG